MTGFIIEQGSDKYAKLESGSGKKKADTEVFAF